MGTAYPSLPASGRVRDSKGNPYLGVIGGRDSMGVPYDGVGGGRDSIGDTLRGSGSGEGK